MAEPTKSQPQLTLTGTISDVLAWVEKMADRGIYNTSTARFKRNALEQFASILAPEEPRTAVYVKDNIDSIAKRWTTKENANPETARTYKSRALGAVTDYLKYQDNPSSIKPKASVPRGTTAKKAAAKAAAESQPPPQPRERDDVKASAGGLRSFPMGSERDPFEFVVPNGMVMNDVIKIACHLMTLADDFDPMNAKTAAVFALARREQ